MKKIFIITIITTLFAITTPVFAASSILGTTDSTPFGITIDSAGNVYTSNQNSDNVTKITPSGVSSILGTTGSTPFGITIDSAGNIYTANYISNNVTKITPSGVSSILGTTDSAPVGITIDSAGNVYTSNQNSDNVTKITPSGVSSILGTTGSTPFGITIDSAGNIYIANGSSNNVSKITQPDTTPPTISEVTPVTTPSNDVTPSYTFTTNEAGTITYSGSCSSATTTATVGSNTITFNTLSEGTYSTCTIRVTDAATNVSNILNIPSFTIDVTPDAAPATPDLITASDTGSSSSDNQTTDVTPSFDITCTEPGTITLYEDGTPVASYTCTGTETTTITAPAVASDGSYDYTTTASDLSGNISGSSPTVTVLIDTSITTTTINAPTTGTPVSGNAEPGSTVTVTTPSGSSCTTTASITGSYSCTLTPSPTDGENITAIATDTYGNTSSLTYNGGIDTNAPTTPTINPVEAGATTITGTGENGTTITLTGMTCTNAPVVVSAGVWSCTILPSDAPEKGDTITVLSTDSAGNMAQGSYVIPKPKSVGSRKLTPSQVNAIFGTPTTTPTESNVFKGKTCSADILLSQNLKAGARNGQYHSYTKTTVKEVKILQAHMNRLGFKSGPVDGILGPITDGAIRRMQQYLGTRTDGLVGPVTRSLINQSC